MLKKYGYSCIFCWEFILLLLAFPNLFFCLASGNYQLCKLEQQLKLLSYIVKANLPDNLNHWLWNQRLLYKQQFD